MVYDAKNQRNHYLDQNSTIEIEVKGGWEKVSWVQGPGGHHPVYGDGRAAGENIPARLYESHDNILDFRRKG